MHPVLSTNFTKHHLDAILITDLNNVRYLSHFTGTNGVILATKERGYFFTDFRYREQAKKQVKGFTTIIVQRDLVGEIAQKLKDYKIKRLGLEAGAIKYAEYVRLEKNLKGIKLVPVTDDPAKIREIKTKIEIKAIERALAINKLAFDEVKRIIKPGISEIEVKTLLEIAMLKHGADKIGFDTIVASGWRGALPHGVASNKKIRAGELVTIDFGCTMDGYNSDETVTIAQGTINKEQRTIHQIVFDAQQAAVAAARPGAKCSDIDKAARDFITKQGYGQYFGHALGHGVGLEVHERPVLSPNSTDILEEGMVFTIEPGIYIPKFGGVRIEDVFVCTKSGARRLSKINKKI
jgi:Xaa-Pro aminopeptidase